MSCACAQLRNRLHTLDLGVNQMTSVGAAALADALKVPLTHSLGAAARHLCECALCVCVVSAQDNCALRELSLWGNEIDAAGAKALAAAFQVL